MPVLRRRTKTPAISPRSWGTGFLLHQRSHDQRLVRLAVRRTGGALSPLAGQHLFQSRVGLLQQLDVTHAAYVLVGVREKPTLGKHLGVTDARHDLTVAEAAQGLLELFLPRQRCTHLAKIPAFD
jgi:hypothetical protein